jgi:hypothetical protein
MPTKYKYNKISKHEGFEENPFIEKAISEIDIVKKTQIVRGKDRSEVKLIVDDKSGEVEGHTAFMRFIEVDEDKFAKLYLSQLSAFWDLSKPSIKVFSYIMTILIPKKDEFYFFMEDCLKYTNYSSERSVFEGLSGLIDAGIIARSSNNVRYFINPLVAFNGSRVTFAKTYIKKKKEKNVETGKLDKKASQLDMFGKS